MSNRKQKLLSQLKKQQTRVADLTRELGELNLGIADTVVKLEREEDTADTKKQSILTRRKKNSFCVGDIVEVTNKYKGVQGNLKGKRGTVLAVGGSFITIDIPSIEGTTFRAPHNLKLITPSTSIEIQNTTTEKI